MLVLLVIGGVLLFFVGILTFLFGLEEDLLSCVIAGFSIMVIGAFMVISAITQPSVDDGPSFEQQCDAHGGFVVENQCLRADNIEKVDIG